MSNDFHNKLADPRNNQKSRGMSFVTNSDQRGSAAYVAQQERERHAQGGAVGHNLHPMNPMQYTAKKQGGMLSQNPTPLTKKRDYQAELDQRIAWQKQLANQRSDMKEKEERDYHARGGSTETSQPKDKIEKQGKRIKKTFHKPMIFENGLEKLRRFNEYKKLYEKLPLKKQEALAARRQKKTMDIKNRIQKEKIQREGVTYGYTKDELEKIKKHLYVGNNPLTDTCSVENIMGRESINEKDPSLKKIGTYYQEQLEKRLKQFPKKKYGTQAMVEAFIDDSNKKSRVLEQNDPKFSERANSYRKYNDIKDTEGLFSPEGGNSTTLMLSARHVPYETQRINKGAKDITDSLKSRREDKNRRAISFLDIDTDNVGEPQISENFSGHNIFALRGHDYTDVLPENNTENLDQSFTMHEPDEGLKRFYSKKDKPTILYDQEKNPYTDLSFQRNKDPERPILPAYISRTLVDD